MMLKTKYDVSWINGGFYIKFFDIIDKHALLEANYCIYGKPQFEEASFQLLDFLEITDFKVQMTEARIIGALDKSASKWNSSMKVAVVTKHPTVLEFTKYYKESLINTNWTCQTFDSIESAMDWSFNY